MHSTKVLRAWELVALSLCLEPKKIGKPGTERFDATKGGAEYERRIDDLQAALDMGELNAQQVYALGSATWTLYAGDFAAWARNQGWKLPQEFDGCEDVNTEKNPVKAPDTSAQPSTPAEQWKQASPERKRELAAEAVKRHGTQEKAAASLAISRQRLSKVLRNSDATVASPFPESVWKPHKR